MTRLDAIRANVRDREEWCCQKHKDRDFEALLAVAEAAAEQVAAMDAMGTSGLLVVGLRDALRPLIEAKP